MRARNALRIVSLDLVGLIVAGFGGGGPPMTPQARGLAVAMFARRHFWVSGGVALAALVYGSTGGRRYSSPRA